MCMFVSTISCPPASMVVTTHHDDHRRWKVFLSCPWLLGFRSELNAQWRRYTQHGHLAHDDWRCLPRDPWVSRCFSVFGIEILHFSISLIISVSEFSPSFPCSFVLPLRLCSNCYSVNLSFCLCCIFWRYVLLFPSLFLFLHNLSVNFWSFSFSFSLFASLLFALWVFRIWTLPPPFSLVFHG